MRLIIIGMLAAALLFTLGLAPAADSPSSQAPAAFDNKTNGLVDDATHEGDHISSRNRGHQGMALGRSTMRNRAVSAIKSGFRRGQSQVEELRVGHVGTRAELFRDSQDSDRSRERSHYLGLHAGQ